MITLFGRNYDLSAFNLPQELIDGMIALQQDALDEIPMDEYTSKCDDLNDRACDLEIWDESEDNCLTCYSDVVSGILEGFTQEELCA